MNAMTMIKTGRCDALVNALKAEFGGILAARILEAEAMDFLWEARVRERYMGQHEASYFYDDEGSDELCRMAFLSLVDGRWSVGACLVNGEGNPVELLWKRQMESFGEAEIGFDLAH